MRKCPFNDCDEHVHDQIFACRKHWFSLSAEDRGLIYSAYRLYTDNQIGVEELRRRQQAVLGARGTA